VETLPARSVCRFELLRAEPPRGGCDVQRTLGRRSNRLLIIGDHLEQMFTVAMNAAAKTRFVREMARVLGNIDHRVTFLFCIRQDYLPDLYDLSQDLPELYERANTFKIQRLSRENGEQALERLSRYGRTSMSERLIARIVKDLADAGEGLVYPPFLQIVGYSLYAASNKAVDGNSLMADGLYDRFGGAETIVNRYLDGLLDDFNREDRPQVGAILTAMVTEYHTKRRVTKQYLQERIPTCHNLQDLLEKLVQNRIIRRSLGEYELIHDFLARRVMELIDKKICLSRPVRLVVGLVENNYQKSELTIEAIAKFSGVSSSHLSGLFKHQLGVSTNHYLNSQRIAAAKRLIVKSRDSMTEIAMNVGFRSLSSFSRKFSQLERMSPLTYRSTSLRGSGGRPLR
jgi:AraC-like DNA-binding protein